jgi:hypothetical protein
MANYRDRPFAKGRELSAESLSVTFWVFCAGAKLV